jgi:PAS domain S-box-containing protein
MNHTIQILAVDDHPENLMALKGVLSVADYELVALRSGEDALRYLLLEDISRLAVILMDVQMPGMNGFETVELIKQRDRCRDIPVIFLTAISTSFDHVIQGYQIGSVDYLFKPIHPQLLRLKVDAFVKLHGYNRKIKEQGEMLRKRALELETANRKLAEAETMLKMQNERLESIVESRTFELIAANDKLLKSQERFKKMFMSSPCPIAIRCLSDFRYIDVNESWKRHTGYGDEVIGLAGNPLQEIVDPMEGDHVRLDQTLRNVRIKYTTKGNEIRDALLSTEIIEIDDEKCLLQVMIDITEKVRYEKEMARLAELNLVGEMAAGIAHEIRNPMTTIRGFLQLLDSNRGSMAKEYIQIMLGELDRANGIIPSIWRWPKTSRPI